MKKLSVVLFALILAAVWTGVSFAAEATPYASIRFQTFYTSFSDSGSADVSALKFSLAPVGKTSRFGVKFKVSDEISGLVEMRMYGSDAGNVVGLRHAFGVYKFNGGQLLIGQTWAPYAVFFPQVYDETAGLRQGAGCLRAPQMRVTLDNGLYVSAIISKLNNDNDKIDIPEISVGYKGAVNGVSVGLHGTYLAVDQDINDEDAYAIMVDLKGKVAGAQLMGRAFYGEDVNNLLDGQFLLSTGAKGGNLASWGVIGAATIYPSDMVALSVGAAYNTTEATVGDDNNELTLWVNAPIKVTKGFTIVPEVAYVDSLDVAGIGGAGTANGADNALWVGAKWQFDL